MIKEIKISVSTYLITLKKVEHVPILTNYMSSRSSYTKLVSPTVLIK